MCVWPACLHVYVHVCVCMAACWHVHVYVCVCVCLKHGCFSKRSSVCKNVRACDVGPYPETDADKLRSAILEYVHETPNKLIDLHGYEKIQGSSAVDGKKMLALGKLIGFLIEVQPECRFKLKTLMHVLSSLAKNTILQLNRSSFDNEKWAKVMASSIMTIMYRWRRLAHSSQRRQECYSRMDPSDADKLEVMLNDLVPGGVDNAEATPSPSKNEV